MSNFARLALLVSFLFLTVSTGCYHLGVHYVEDGSFTGIAGGGENSKVTSILIVHGMGGYSKGDPDGIIAETVKQMKLTPSPKKHETVYFKDDSQKQKLGRLKRTDFIKPNSAGEVRIYTLYWNEATDPIKKKFIGDDSDKKKNPDRLSLNHFFKSGMVNNNLADVVLYLGEYGKTMRKPLKESVMKIAHDAEGVENHQIFLVSFSLGSIMLLDAIYELLGEGACKADASTFCQSVKTFFMLANQVPLLMMGKYAGPTDEKAASDSKKKAEEVDTLGEFLAEQRKGDVKGVSSDFRIVAFSDPNDLLSYRIPDSLSKEYDENRDTFINVVTSVARVGWIIPCVVEFANPLKAHTGYGHAQKVLDLMINGYESSRND